MIPISYFNMIMFFITLQISYEDFSTKMTCDEAFNLYKKIFKKSYPKNQISEIMEIFCRNYADLQHSIDVLNCTYCGLTLHLDRDFKTLVNYKTLMSENDNSLKHLNGKNQKIITRPTDPKTCWDTSNQCQKYSCGISPTIPQGTTYFNRIDLREARIVTQVKNQGDCGSCWAFALTAVLENAMLYDIMQGLTKTKPFWNFTDKTLNLSEQYALSNTWGFAEYCAGGNGVGGINGMACAWDSVELTSNFQYNIDFYEPFWRNKKIWNITIKPQDYHMPFKIRPYAKYNTVIGITKLHEGSNGIPLSQKPENLIKIKQHLSAGLVVLGVMYMPENGPIVHATGGFVADFPCPENGIRKLNHQIVFVGYGKMNGQDVWIIRNSWGPKWGANGYFFAPINQNMACTEYQMVVVTPTLFDEKAFLKIPPGRQMKDKDDQNKNSDQNVAKTRYWLDPEELVEINPITNETIKYTGPLDSYFQVLEDQTSNNQDTNDTINENEDDNSQNNSILNQTDTNKTDNDTNKENSSSSTNIIVFVFILAILITVCGLLIIANAKTTTTAQVETEII